MKAKFELLENLKQRKTLFSHTVNNVNNPLYNWEIERIKKIDYVIQLIENDEITPESFNKLSDRDKWEIYPILKNKVTWYCRCGTKQKIVHAGVNIICCKYCDRELTRRTGGGQNNPFNWVFKYKKKELRRKKLKKINESQDINT